MGIFFARGDPSRLGSSNFAMLQCYVVSDTFSCCSLPCVFEGVYLAALGTDWLQQAYLFVLLKEYHPERFVVRMYLAGVASQLSLSVLLEVIGGFVPHKMRCAACLALQAGSAAFLVHPAFGGLVTSRVLGGFAAALLHSSFEAWMVEQVRGATTKCYSPSWQLKIPVP